MTRAIVKRKPNNKQNTRTIRQTVGLGLGLIASEHFFSSMLTSPMTTRGSSQKLRKEERILLEH